MPDVTPAREASGKPVILGRLGGAHGLKGWLRVFSCTQPRENIFAYRPWLLERDGGWIEQDFSDSECRGAELLVRFAGVEDRDAAGAWVNRQVAVWRARLPEPAPGEYYWADLLGLEVVTLSGDSLGKVVELRETGANDVLIVAGKTRCLVPFIRPDVVRRVDLENGAISVDWQTGW